jgi:hypothetical protein
LTANNTLSPTTGDEFSGFTSTKHFRTKINFFDFDFLFEGSTEFTQSFRNKQATRLALRSIAQTCDSLNTGILSALDDFFGHRPIKGEFHRKEQG